MSDIPGRKVSDALSVNTKAIKELARTVKQLTSVIQSLLAQAQLERSEADGMRDVHQDQERHEAGAGQAAGHRVGGRKPARQHGDAR